MKYFLTIAIALIIIGCNKEKLSRASEKGNNTASWSVGDKSYKIDDANANGIPPLHVAYLITSEGPQLTVTARNNRGNVPNVVLMRVYNYQGPGIYLLNSDKNFGRLELNSVSYDNLSTRLGYLQITKDDKNEGVIAGKFEFVCNSSEGPLKVTQGRFDFGGW